MRLALLAVIGLFAQDSRQSAQAEAVALNSEALKLVEAKKFDEAFVAIEKARKLAPSDDVITRNAARILTRRAQAGFEAGTLEAAEADLNRALEIAPKETMTRITLAMLFRSRGEPDRARREVQRALADEPGSAAAFEELGRVAYEEEDLTAALQALDTALKLDPSRAAAIQSFRDKVEREAKIETTCKPVVRGQFIVKFDDQKFRDVGEVVLGFLDAAEAQARRTLGHVPSRNVTVILYSREDFTATTGAHGWAGGLFDGKIRLPVRNFEQTRDSIKRTIAHEYTHLVVRDLTRKCPIWLNEGLAQLAEEKSLAAARETVRGQKEPKRFSTMPASWMSIQDPKVVAELYAESLLFTRYLVEKLSYQAIKDLLVKTNGTVAFDAAFAEVAGKSLDEVEADWRAGR
jgi:tetratricopeptide (TPR) repeat protein